MAQGLDVTKQRKWGVDMKAAVRNLAFDLEGDRRMEELFAILGEHYKEKSYFKYVGYPGRFLSATCELFELFINAVRSEGMVEEVSENTRCRIALRELSREFVIRDLRSCKGAQMDENILKYILHEARLRSYRKARNVIQRVAVASLAIN